MEFFCYLPVSIQDEVFGGRLLLNRKELGDALLASHETFIAGVNRLPVDLFGYSLPGKWSAAIQLAHLSLCLEGLSKALQLKEVLPVKFGVIERSSMSSMQLVRFYRERLAEGGKAPERFIPQQVDSSDRDAWIERLREVLKNIKHELLDFKEAELDRFALPHPLLGNLSVREMTYLMIFHAPYHLAQVKCQLDQRLRMVNSSSN